MPTSLSELKTNRTQNFEKRLEKLNKENTKTSYKDERIWKPTPDKTGVAKALIRFLPAPPGEEDAHVKVWDHAFKGPGGWYFENSLTTLGQADPLAELNRQLWAKWEETGNPVFRDQARNQKRRTNFYANILVIKDYGNPENNGKVFLYKFGQKIFEKIDAVQNDEDKERRYDPFDPWDGADFFLRMTTNAQNFPNYDNSSFEPRSALYKGDDAAIEKLWKSEYSLQDFRAPSKFKSYAELKARLEKVLNASLNADEADEGVYVNTVKEADTDDDLERFRSLANSPDDEIPF